MDEWEKWQNHVLAELDRNTRMHEKQIQEIQKIRIELAQLKVKAGLWGMIAGSIPALVFILMKVIGRQ